MVRIPTRFAILVLAGAAATAVLHCAGGRLVTVSNRVLSEGDSLFNSGDYLHAKMVYQKIRDSETDSMVLQDAQYKLGYINVYYNNPFGDWEEGLREFQRYQTQYPNGRKSEEVNSWVTLLHSIESYQSGFNNSFSQAKDFKTRSSDEAKKVQSLMEALLKCETVKDSLIQEVNFLQRKVADYEELILKVQKIGTK